KEAIQIWDSVKVPFLFNRKVAFVFYIEKGFLDFAIYILKEKKWFKGGFSGIKNFHDFDFKQYFNEINENAQDEIGSVEATKYLNYYIHFIDEFLPEIINGDFSKLENVMESMDENQIIAIYEMIEER